MMQDEGKRNDQVGPDSVLAEIVRRHPEAGRIMLEYGLHCVGCFVSAHETIEAGAKVHGLSGEETEEMLVRINGAIEESQKLGGEKN